MSKQRTSLSISVRRHFVDKFFFSHENLFSPGIKTLDVGGKKNSKRGLFDIDKYELQVKYVNIDRSASPDIISDASNIPLPDKSVDLVILGEILEHVPEPFSVLKEAYRLLQCGGIVLVTVPFLYPIHADPDDYGRYTESFWKRISKRVGFKNVEIERQGTIFAVAALMVQHIFRAKNISWRPIQDPLVKFLMWLDSKTISQLLKSWTTGYGLVLIK